MIQKTKEGIFIVSNIHDGFLTGLTLLPEKRLKLNLITALGKEYALILNHLVALKADNFRQGNIIFDIHLYEGSACPRELIQKVYDYNDSDAEKYLTKRTEEIITNSWYLLNLSASYGCELLALCADRVSNIAILE